MCPTISRVSVVPGSMVTSGSSGGSVRSFALPSNLLRNVEQRGNTRHDVLLTLKAARDRQRARLPLARQKRQEKCDKQRNHGIQGPCILRSCSEFDVGASFMSDSLHNVYIGAFVRVLAQVLDFLPGRF
jgi:hypothetical protein